MGFDVLKEVRREFPRYRPLMADAVGVHACRYRTSKSFDEFNLMMLEQPLAHDDIIDHAKLQAEIKTRSASTNRSKSVEDTRKAIEACLGPHHQPKERPCRRPHTNQNSSRPSAAKTTFPSGAAVCSNPASAAHITSPSPTLAGYTMPGDVSASKRYWHEDIITPEVEVSSDGTITAPDGPGIGFEIKHDTIQKLTVRETTISN
ncbi:MAG: hypothetical protein R2682_07525 [Pyrinomonadaceae bacterium]